jgi:hypothetical protein
VGHRARRARDMCAAMSPVGLQEFERTGPFPYRYVAAGAFGREELLRRGYLQRGKRGLAAAARGCGTLDRENLRVKGGR